MVTAGAASLSGVRHVPERNWSGYNGTPLSTGKIIRLNVHCFASVWVPAVQLAVNAYIVPDDAVAHNIILGTDSWALFPVREYVDVRENETILTLRTTQHESRCAVSVSSAAQRMTACTECVFQTGREHRLMLGQDNPVSCSRDHRYWITVNIVTSTRGCKVSTGLYCAGLREEWNSSEIVVDARGCQLPLTSLVDISLKCCLFS